MRTIHVVLSVLIISTVFILAISCRDNEPEIGEIIDLELDLVIDGNVNLDELFTPGCILITSNSSILIVDPVCMKVLAFDSTGQFLFEFGRPGEGPGEFSWLNLHCDIDCDDNIYLVNMPHWIEVFNIHGEYLERIPPDVENIFDFAVYDPNTIFINAVALNDWGDYHPVIEIDRTGETVNAFGYIDIDTENMPRWQKFAVSQCLIDVDEEGFVYYTSVVDYRIFKYDPEGNLVYTIEESSPFDARYEPQPPHGMRTLIPVVMDLCVDENRIYVLWGQGADERGSRVDILDKDTGELLGYFYTQVPTEQCNVFIEVVDGTHLYTASYSNAIVYKFRISR
jgi:hypothetical protein